MSPFNFDKEAADANAELAGQIAGLAPLSPDDVAKLFPAPKDQEAVAKLREIVNAATSQNTKVAALQTNLQQVGGVVVGLLQKLLT
jgi:hypothetical protein